MVGTLALAIRRTFSHYGRMDALDHPLDWWAYGGYPMVMRELRCTKVVARHQVHAKIDEYYRRTNTPLWNPLGNRG